MTTQNKSESGTDGKPNVETKADASDLRRDIANTRADMGNTLDQLHAKLNPTVLKEQAVEQIADLKMHLKTELQEAKESLKAEVKAELSDAKAAVREATVGKVEHVMQEAQSTVKRTSRSFADTIVENPVPAALAGVGIAWLIFAARSRSTGQPIQAFESVKRGATDVAHRAQATMSHAADRAQSTLGTAATNAQHGVTDAASAVASKVSSLAHNAQDKVGHLAHDASDRVTHLAHDASESARHFADDASRRGRELRTSVADQFDTRPLIAGAVMVAVGTAVGLALPITRKEEKLLGAVREQVVHKAEDLAHTAVEQASALAKNALEQGKSKLEGSSHSAE